MQPFSVTVGQTVGVMSRWKNVRRGVVLRVTPTGRAVVKVTNPDGHSYERTFDAFGVNYPKMSFDNDHLVMWTARVGKAFAESQREVRARVRSAQRQTRKERLQQDRDNQARAYLRTLADAAPTSALRTDAINLLARW